MGGRLYTREESIALFWKKVDKKESDDCWEWTGWRHPCGHGQLRINKKAIYSHRFSMELYLGLEIPGDKKVCHSCDNPSCVNPAHLFIGTQKDNIQDMLGKGRGLVGSKNGHAKVTEDDVRQIRRLYKSGWTNGRLAREYKISTATVHGIVMYKSWKHVSD